MGCSAFHWPLEYGHSNVKDGRWTHCCSKGTFVGLITPIPRPTGLLNSLIHGSHGRKQHFLKNSVRYNAAFAFASILADRHPNVNLQGINSYQISGVVYHRQGPLYPDHEFVPKYAQLYFYDNEQATDLRAQSKVNAHLDRTLLGELTVFFHQNNVLSDLYKSAGRQMEEYKRLHPEAAATLRFGPRMEVVLDVDNTGFDGRTMNLPVSDEVAAFFPDTAGLNFLTVTLERISGQHESGITGHIQRGDPVLEDRRIPGGHAAIERAGALEGEVFHDGNSDRIPGRLNIIPVKSRLLLPASYPLIFPFGSGGYDLPGYKEAKRNTGVDVPSLRQFFRFHLFQRTAHDSLFHMRRLFQQFLVGGWATAEQEDLNWVRTHQNDIRSDTLRGLQDVWDINQMDPDRAGVRVYMPTSHIGSVRFMRRCYMDSMAIVSRLGEPTIFLTFTANPQWTEIQDKLVAGQSATDRPDLVSRVFNDKLQALLKDLKDGIFGKYWGRVWTIEYQKRGLPHAHILLFLSPEDRQLFLTPTHIDKFISAEFPSLEEDPDGVLTALVLKHMVHGKCGPARPKQPCMVGRDGRASLKCTKRFPWPFRDDTSVDGDDYPRYRRQDDRRVHVKKERGQEIEYHNGDVVPYSPYLLRRYGSHLNVEVCASVTAIKYIHKYLHKGPDRATVRVVQGVDDGNSVPGAQEMRVEGEDELKTYLNRRWITPCEAVWRIMEFSTQEQVPPVDMLPVELPGHEAIRWRTGTTAQQLAQRMQGVRTKLTAYFEYNNQHHDGKDLTYLSFPERFRWVAQSKSWTKRARYSAAGPSAAVGRCWFVNPKERERWYLMLLLKNVKGPRSFQDLATVRGVQHPTFREACEDLGLVTSGTHWVSVFEEVASWATGRHQRDLFVTALIFGELEDVQGIWNRFKCNFCDDLPRQVERFPDVPANLEHPHFDYGLYLLSRTLDAQGSSLRDMGLAEPIHSWRDPVEDAAMGFAPETTFAQDVRDAAWALEHFNADQMHCFREITAKIDSEPSRAHFFTQGAAGMGKTFLYKGLNSHYRAAGKHVINVASTGVAALLLPQGKTAHLTFSIPIDCDEASVCRIRSSRVLKGVNLANAIIIWDEFPMSHRHNFEAVHRGLCDFVGVPENGPLCAGIPVIFGGDYAQIPPVVLGGDRPRIVAASTRFSPLFRLITVLRLTINMRLSTMTPDNQDFSRWIQEMSTQPQFHGALRLPDAVQVTVDDQDFQNEVFPPELFRAVSANTHAFAGRAILTAKRRTVAQLNDDLMDKVPGEPVLYLAENTLETHDGTDQYPTELIAGVDADGLPPSSLILKVGSPIMCLRNLSPVRGLCNGTRLTVTRLTPRCVMGTIMEGDFKGEIHLIPRVKLFSMKNKLNRKLTRVQLPVQPAFAVTINKAQGQTLEFVGVDVRQPAFCHGQLYVALSRVRDTRHLRILNTDEDPFKKGEEGYRWTQNVIFPELLL